VTAPNLEQLAQELAAAGIVTDGLGWDAERGVYTFGEVAQDFQVQTGEDADGQPVYETQTHTVSGAIVPLPDAAAPVVAAHVPAAPVDPVAQADAAFYAAMSAATTVAQIKAATLAWMTARPGIAAPTAANG
jgi:hypothetical protein